MATKKQKRERGLAKREEYMAKVKAEGLEALRRDREFRETKREILLLEGLAEALKIKPGTGVAYDEVDRAKRFAQGFAVGQE